MTLEATILIVNPNTTASMTDTMVTAAQRVVGRGFRVRGSTASRGVPSVETNSEEVWAALGVLEQVRAGEAQGVSGYVIGCFGDPGLAAAKEVAAGPAVGMTEAALFTAALISERFSIVTLPPRTRAQSHRVLRETGLASRCTVRAVDVEVSDVAEGSSAVLEAIHAEAARARHDDGAEAIVLGCAGLGDLVIPLQDALAVPIVDGVAAGLKMVEGLLGLGLTTSRRSTYAQTDGAAVTS